LRRRVVLAVVSTVATSAFSCSRKEKESIDFIFQIKSYLLLSKFVSILISKAIRSAFFAPFGTFSLCLFNRDLSPATVNASIYLIRKQFHVKIIYKEKFYFFLFFLT
jgi:hypothetical protein